MPVPVPRYRYRLRFKPDPKQLDANRVIQKLVHDCVVPPRQNQRSSFAAMTARLFNKVRFTALKARRDFGQRPDEPTRVIDPTFDRATWMFRCKPFGGFAQVVDLQTRKAIELKHTCKVVKWCPHCYARRLDDIRKALEGPGSGAYTTLTADVFVAKLTWPQRRTAIMECRETVRTALRRAGETKAAVCSLMRSTDGGTWWLRMIAILPVAGPVGYAFADLPIQAEKVHAQQLNTDIARAMEHLAYPPLLLVRRFVKEQLPEYFEATSRLPEVLLMGITPLSSGQTRA